MDLEKGELNREGDTNKSEYKRDIAIMTKQEKFG